MAEEKGKKNGESEKFITAVLDVHLRCNCIGCVRRLRKACFSIHGVSTVKEDVNGNKVHVSGVFDPVKLREKIHTYTAKKVELVSPLPPKKDESKSKNEQKESPKHEKEPAATMVVIKMAWHCEGCTNRICKFLFAYKGVQRVQMDKAKELITVTCTAEPKLLAEHLQKKLKRPVQIVPEKKEKEEKNQQQQQNQEGGKKKGGGGGGGGSEEGKGASGDNKGVTKVEYFMMGTGYGCREASSGYVVDVFYPPQMFSEDNPNSCSIM